VRADFREFRAVQRGTQGFSGLVADSARGEVEFENRRQRFGEFRFSFSKNGATQGRVQADRGRGVGQRGCERPASGSRQFSEG